MKILTKYERRSANDLFNKRKKAAFCKTNMVIHRSENERVSILLFLHYFLCINSTISDLFALSSLLFFLFRFDAIRDPACHFLFVFVGKEPMIPSKSRDILVTIFTRSDKNFYSNDKISSCNRICPDLLTTNSLDSFMFRKISLFLMRIETIKKIVNRNAVK